MLVYTCFRAFSSSQLFSQPRKNARDRGHACPHGCEKSCEGTSGLHQNICFDVVFLYEHIITCLFTHVFVPFSAYFYLPPPPPPPHLIYIKGRLSRDRPGTRLVSCPDAHRTRAPLFQRPRVPGIMLSLELTNCGQWQEMIP